MSNRSKLGANPTANYHSTSNDWGKAVAYLYHGKPWFTYWHIPLMKRDSWLRFLARVWRSPFASIPIQVKANRPEVEAWVVRQYERFKRACMPKLLNAYFWYGFAPGGIEWKQTPGQRGGVPTWDIDTVRRIQPADAKPRVFTKSSKFAGFTTESTGEVLSPHAFWFSGFGEAGQYYDEPPVSGAFDEFLEYWTKGGARHLRIIAARKHSIQPSVGKYPTGNTPVARAGGTEEKVNNKILMLSTLEGYEAGGNVVLPSDVDDKGNAKWSIEPSKMGVDPKIMSEYPKDLRQSMAAGIGIPMEVIEAAESGSGWSGRKVPYKAFLTGVDELGGMLFETFDQQALRVGLRENFGKGADYEAIPQSLVKKLEDEDGGNGDKAGGGGGPLGQQPGGNPLASMFGGGGSGAPKQPFEMSGLSAAISSTERRNRQDAAAKVIAFAAMLDLQELAHEEGEPEKYGDEIQAITDLMNRPQELLKFLRETLSIKMGWIAATSSTGRLMAKGTDEQAGKKLYGKRAESVLNRGDKKAKVQASTARAGHLTSKAVMKDATAEDFAELADHLPALDRQSLRYARAKLGASFKGKTRREDMVAALVEHVKQLHAEALNPQPEPESQPEPEQKPRQAPGKRKDGTPAKPSIDNVYTVDPKTLKTDPARFQYKVSGIKADGVSDELRGVGKWNPALGGTLLVWRDPADQQDYVVNGHHRHELASRVGAKNVNVRYLDASTPTVARAAGALANIAEGRGSALDAAKFMRDTGSTPDELRGYGVSLAGKVAADAVNLRDLSDKAFNALARGDILESTAVAVSKNLKDHALQDLLFKRLAQREEDGKEWGPREIETAARKMAKAGKVTESGVDLFGGFEDEKSTFDQEVEIESHIGRILGQRANDFAAVANAKRAERVADAGNVLAVDENKKRAQAAAAAVEDFDRESGLKSKVSDIIKEHAAELFGAKTRKQRDDIKQRAAAAVEAAISGQADTGAKTGVGGTNAQDPQPTAAASGGATAASEPAVTPAVDENLLQSHGMLREFGGRWQWKINPDAKWFTSNSKEDAISQAARNYNNLPDNQKITAAERGAQADQKEYDDLHSTYGKYSLDEVQKIKDRADGVIGVGIEKEIRDGKRSSGAAMANQGARDAKELSMKLNRYIERRKQNEPAAAAPQPVEEPKPAAPNGTDLFGRPLPKQFAKPKAGQQIIMEDSVRDMWHQKAEEFADEQGGKIEQRTAGGQFRIGDKWYQVGKGEDGYPITETAPVTVNKPSTPTTTTSTPPAVRASVFTKPAATSAATSAATPGGGQSTAALHAAATTPEGWAAFAAHASQGTTGRDELIKLAKDQAAAKKMPKGKILELLKREMGGE